MTFASTGSELAFLFGRVLFAAIIATLAVGNLANRAEMVAYAEHKGVPLASASVPLGSLALIAGATAILLGAYPLAGSLAVAGFLVAVTPVMHDFWALEGDDAQAERIHFLKNVGLLGGALLFAALAGAEWPYAVGGGLV